MRLIDADEFLLTTKVGCTLASMCTANTAKREILKVTYELIKERIGEADTVEAEPVKHSKWLDVRCEVKCSCCGETYSDEIFLMRGEINYCPNCGAKMDGGDENA